MEKLNSIEEELKRMNNLLECILQCVRPQKAIEQKPSVLPVRSVTELLNMNSIDEETYSKMVSYLHSIGGFNAKEAINLCFKETMDDSVLKQCTWWGRDDNQCPLYNSRIIMAIYDAVCTNSSFAKPTKMEFQHYAKEALRAGKERCRNKQRQRLVGSCSRNKPDKSLWRD